MREGDLVSDDVSPLLATVTAWGRDRAEALSRLRKALERLTVVIGGGATDRGFLLAVLARPELAAGPVDDHWLRGLLADGALTAPADPVAVVAAAVETYDRDQALAESAFRSAAARGRPERPEAVGSRMALAYRGTHYPLRVDRTGPGTYQVHADAGVAGRAALTVAVEVEKINAYEFVSKGFRSESTPAGLG